MAKETVEKFLRKLPEDSKMRETYAASMKRATENAMMETAKSAGFDFTLQELRAVLDERASALSEEELQRVVGGIRTAVPSVPGQYLCGTPTQTTKR